MSVAPPASTTGFEAQEACHQQILEQLTTLTALAQHIETAGIDAWAQQQAGVVEAFFSGTSRQHHLDEEKNVFPSLLAGSDAELAGLVRV